MQSVMHYGSNYFLTDAAQAAGLSTMTGWFLFKTSFKAVLLPW